jgi:hypothetical protein
MFQWYGSGCEDEMRATEPVAAHIIEQRRLVLKERVFYVTHFRNPTKLADLVVNNQSGCCVLCVLHHIQYKSKLVVYKLISKELRPLVLRWGPFFLLKF